MLRRLNLNPLNVQRIGAYIPITFIVYRFLVAPLLFLAARDGYNTLFLIGFILACASDLFDGVIARRLHIVTQGLREWDGRADVWFYAWIGAAIWVTYPQVLLQYGAWLLLVIGLQLASWLLDLIKFHRFTNYHAYSAKALGTSLFLAIVALFTFGSAGVFMWLVIVTGIICMLEEIAMTLILPRWTFDVSGVRHAWQIRQAVLHGIH